MKHINTPFSGRCSLYFLTVIIPQLNMEHLLFRKGKGVNLICRGNCHKKDRLCGKKQHWVCDFESGLLPALRTQFPNATIKGCYFHHIQGYVTCTRSGTSDRLQ